MPYQRLKSESYQLFGGINQKASPTDLSAMEFLDISNFDFNASGALQTRPGTTQAISGGAVLNATTTVGFVGTTGAVNITAPLYGNYGGTLFIQTGASYPGGIVSSNYEFTNLQAASFIMFSAPGVFSYGASLGYSLPSFTLNQIYYSTGNTFNFLLDPAGKAISSTDYPINPNWSFKTFVNRLFFCNGDHFFKWDGYTAIGQYQISGGSPGQLAFALTSGASAAAGSVYAAYNSSVFYGTFIVNSFVGVSTMITNLDGTPYVSGVLSILSGSGSSSVNYSSFSLIVGSQNVESYYPLVPSAYKYNLPNGTSLFAQVLYSSGYSLDGITAGNFNSATYTYSYGFINERGFRGCVSSPITVSISLPSSTLGPFPLNVALFGFSSAFNGGSIIQTASGFTVPDGFGIGCTQIIGYQGITSTSSVTTSIDAKVCVYRDNGSGTGRYLIGYAYPPPFIGVGITLVPYSGPYPYSSVGIFGDSGATLPNAGQPEPTCIYATLPPQFLEIYNNQMFACGFSQAPSTVQFSDIGEPESIQPENNFDVRTNDGDYLTGMKSAFSQLFFFKNNSFHVLSGDDPTNFVLTPISDQYGCISNRAIATYESYLMFLDKKGIVLFNGAAPVVASTKIDPLFAQMNLQAAAQNAWMVHNKVRNQIWCGIPINGSTMINQIIVFDYLLNAWTHFDGINAACAEVGYGSLSYPTPYIGGYTSQLAYYGSSLTGDFWSTSFIMNWSWQSRFFSDQGQSVEKMWRRLFLNVLSAQNATNLWNVALFANYASLASTTFVQGGASFQSRSDFGVSAKALSVKVSGSGNSDTLQFSGLTVESRFQRNT